MVTITYVSFEGQVHQVDADTGISLMQLALSKGIPGIVGQCGGVMSCATCHVYVDEKWYERLSPPRQNELDMLEFAEDPAATSRLACQIKVRAELDGLVVRIPRSQQSSPV